MSARKSKCRSQRNSNTWWLTSLLFCIAMTGCQSTTLRQAGQPSSVHRDAPVQLVSSQKATSKPEAWQLQKTQREQAAKEAALESKAKHTVAHASFERGLWQSNEPAPFVSDETSWCSTCPMPDCRTDCECPELCFGCDLSHSLPKVWCDAKGVLNWNNGLILAGAGGLAIVFREGDIDRDVREQIAQNPDRWGDGSKFLGHLGEAYVQVPVMLSLYGYSVWTQNEELHDVMGSLLSAGVITGVTTTALKLVTNTDRPTDDVMNGHYGFPSYHAASMFSIAAVLDEYYGCKVGLPAYLLAGAVGYSRLDTQDHDLSDVVFGSVMGFVIGKAVAGRHLCGNSEIQFTPYFHPTDGTPGVGFERRF